MTYSLASTASLPFTIAITFWVARVSSRTPTRRVKRLAGSSAKDGTGSPAAARSNSSEAGCDSPSKRALNISIDGRTTGSGGRTTDPTGAMIRILGPVAQAAIDPGGVRSSGP